MAPLLDNISESKPGTRSGPLGLVVNGVRFANSAAKFWPALLDELAADYPACDALILETLSDPVLDRDLLFPANALQCELDRRRGRRDFREELRAALAQFDMVGPPGAVRARLIAGPAELAALDLPRDCIDADVFPCLLVWLLEWAEIPPGAWNNPEVGGAFSARDRERGIVYRLRFDLRNTHLSEGLFRRALTLRYAMNCAPGA